MDKQTLSNYGWLVIVTLILAVMLAFATPFGTYVGDGVVSIANGFVGASDQAIDEDNIAKNEDKWDSKFDYSILSDNKGIYGKNSPTLNHNGIIPEGGTYLIGASYFYCSSYDENVTYFSDHMQVLSAGDTFPVPQEGDIYIYGNYAYGYKLDWAPPAVGFYQLSYASYTHCEPVTEYMKNNSKWAVKCIQNVANPGTILETICGEPITNMNYTYEDIYDMKVMPEIPPTVISLDNTYPVVFDNVVEIPNGVISMYGGDSMWLNEKVQGLSERLHLLCTCNY